MGGLPSSGVGLVWVCGLRAGVECGGPGGLGKYFCIFGLSARREGEGVGW